MHQPTINVHLAYLRGVTLAYTLLFNNIDDGKWALKCQGTMQGFLCKTAQPTCARGDDSREP